MANYARRVRTPGLDNISPATGKVLGSTAAAGATRRYERPRSAPHAEPSTRAIGRPTAQLRKRCLLQLHDALEREREQLRDEIIAEVGAPAMTTTMAQVDWPMADALAYPAALIDTFGWERELGAGTAGAPDDRRRVVKEAMGVVAAITPWNYPFEIVSNKLGRPLPPAIPWCSNPIRTRSGARPRSGPLIAEHTDIPAGVVNIVDDPG